MSNGMKWEGKGKQNRMQAQKNYRKMTIFQDFIMLETLKHGKGQSLTFGQFHG